MDVKNNEISGEKGLVFNIQRFSIHDGPGIRTTVFMKGCPLDCKWCSNPESKDCRPALLARDLLCGGCGKCVEACHVQAISFSKETGRVIDWTKCNHCLKCVDVCLFKSLNAIGKWMTIDECMVEIMSDLPFYQNSGGGVTLSGGEPLRASNFVSRLLKRCKDEGLHTAIETSGFAKWDLFSEVLKYTDLVLYDVKHTDSGKHLEGTGVNNELILRNLAKAAKTNEIWIRIPLVAGYNDAKDNIAHVALLAKDLGIKRISLLPYHAGGESKCAQLGMDYAMPGAVTPTDEAIKELALMGRELGLEVMEGF